ncbi:serine hydrolase domain-containing protein [Phytohabitans houttuyneae]|uniref:Serine hydrolase n=1 Tax=Phytohabitans houttuyneae TaxID=1076126 RepID=A0A6V8KQR1_9ACTN|nr:serine hydrolase domain-containing protein [Phytohabitans houttuyneae]GFJ86184.1 serine hydrolase [Phytohabitans houttuyneae]
MSLLPETTRRLDVLAAEAQATGRAPSVVLGVVRDGALAYATGAGDHPVPDPGTQYRIGSISKTMTATLVMRLRDEGRLALDDLLYRHLPGTPVGSVTLRQLLGHASGLQREPDSAGWWERSEGSDVETLLAGLTPDKLAHPPHRTYHYSNLAYGLLGAVVERITGKPWIEVLTERVLAPLSMLRTTYHPHEPFAPGYVVHPLYGTLNEEPRTDTGAMAPAGQLWSTLDDLARWAAFLAEPVPDVLAPDTLAEMCVPVAISDPDTWSGGHGLGLEFYRRGERVLVGHGGSMPGYVSLIAVHRPSRTGIVGYANAYGFPIGQLGFSALVEVLDREPAPPAPWRPAAAPPPPEAAELCGRWWWMGLAHDATWEKGELVITRAGREPWRFAAEGADRWRCHSGVNDGETLAVRRDGAGGVAALDIATFVFTRDPGQLG